MDGSTTLLGVPLGFIVLGLVQVAKISGLPSQWAPLLAVMLGLVGGVALGFASGASDGMVWATDVSTGLLAGLGAAGIYSGTKATLKK